MISKQFLKLFCLFGRAGLAGLVKEALHGSGQLAEFGLFHHLALAGELGIHISFLNQFGYLLPSDASLGKKGRPRRPHTAAYGAPRTQDLITDS